MLGAGSAFGPDGSVIGSMQFGGSFRAKDGSIISGSRASAFQRGTDKSPLTYKIFLKLFIE